MPDDTQQFGHSGREERWVAEPVDGDSSSDGRSYVRWVCSCGVTSDEFIDQGNECELNWRRHAGIDREPDAVIPADDDDEYPRHPLADKFTCPKWDKPGRCVCGAKLPPQRLWHNAGNAWQHVQCRRCGFGYVDEDDFIAMYDDGTDCGESDCWDPRSFTGRRRRLRFTIRRARRRLTKGGQRA